MRLLNRLIRGTPRRFALLGVLALAAGLLVAGPAAAAEPGTGGVRFISGTVESSPSLNIRGGPGTGYNVHGTLGYGAKIVVACWETGNSITATWPDGETYSTDVWDALIDSTNLPTGMYVSDAWVNTGGDTSTMVPACSDLPADPSGYPWPNVSETGPDPVDGYGFQQGQCTSFAAWEIRSDRLPHTKNAGTGDASMWTGLTSTSTPHVGEVAQWDPNVHGAGGKGHVAYVAAVYPDTNTILVYEYNWTDASDNYQYLRLSERTVYLNHTDYTGPPSRYLKY